MFINSNNERVMKTIDFNIIKKIFDEHPNNSLSLAKIKEKYVQIDNTSKFSISSLRKKIY